MSGKNGRSARLQVKVQVEPYEKDGLTVGPNVTVWGRVRTGKEVGEWFVLPAKYLSLELGPSDVARAAITILPELVETDPVIALVDKIYTEEDRS